MTKRLFAVIAILMLSLAACGGPPVNRDLSRQLTTVPAVDLNRYAGVWYEVARFENSFEKDCVGVTATYGRNPDGTISVKNSCRMKALDGEENVAEGVARVIDTATNAKLAVSFFWPFFGDYWIIGLDPDYRWAVVGAPRRDYLWVLSRTPVMAEADYAAAVAIARREGFAVEKLQRTVQP